MRTVVSGADYSNSGLGRIVDINLEEELKSVYGSGNVTDEKVLAIQVFMSRIGWGLDFGIYPKLQFVLLPFMCGGTASMSAFYDLVHKREVTVGTSPVVNSSNVANLWTFDSYGCYPKKLDDSTTKSTAINIPSPYIKAFESSEFALLRRNANARIPGGCWSNGTGRMQTTSVTLTVDGTRQTASGSYFHGNLGDAGVDSNTITCYVNTGIGDFASDKIVTNGGECFYDSETGTVNKATLSTYVTFGGPYNYNNSDAKEMYTFEVMGLAVGLNVNEARILRDALMELKAVLDL